MLVAARPVFSYAEMCIGLLALGCVIHLPSALLPPCLVHGFLLTESRFADTFALICLGICGGLVARLSSYRHIED